MPVPSNPPRLKRSTAKNQVLERLQEWIAGGVLKPGEKIVDAELAEALGVSRTPVREALQILETQGLIETVPGKATRVTSISAEDVYLLYPPLAALESTAAELAAKSMDEEKIRFLKQVNRLFHQAIRSGDREEAIKWDELFHRTIVEETRNPWLIRYVANLQLHIKRYKYTFFGTIHFPAEPSVEEHETIIAALERRNPEEAARWMKRNWLRAMEILAEKAGKAEK